MLPLYDRKGGLSADPTEDMLGSSTKQITQIDMETCEMKPFNRALQLSVLGLATTLIASCGSSEKKAETRKGTDVFSDGAGGKVVIPNWWENPGAIGKFSAIGSAKIIGSYANAKRTAEVQARATLAASLEATIQSLTELWSQETGDAMNEASLASYFNNEQFTRQLVDTTLRGARVDRYAKEDGEAFCLVILEKPEDFLDNLVQKVEEDTMKEDTYFETEVKKGKARDALDSLVNGAKADAEKEKAARAAALAAGQ